MCGPFVSSAPMSPPRARARELDPEAVGLPVRPFLYTLDQIATLLEITEQGVHRHVHFEGVAPGARPRDRMVARNLAPAGERPDWRVAERELLRWMRVKGFRFYERGWARA